MPNIKSAIKRVKVTEKKNLRNRIIMSQLRTILKKIEAESKESGFTQELQGKAFSAIDKAAAKGVIHRNYANRRKARISASLNNA